MRTGLQWALLSLGCALAQGCTSSDGEDAGSALETSSGSLALVQLERFVDPESAMPRVVAGAKVARYRAIEGDALLRLLGADARDLETCTSASGFSDLAIAPEARVELLSVGDISMRVGESRNTLSPRLFPALATTASGWFYAGDTELSAPRAELDEYVLTARGADGVGGFELVVAAPGEVLGLGLAGAPLETDGVLDRSHDLEITWEAEDPRDRVEFEIFAGGSALSCACRDDGHFVLTHAQLAGLEPDDNASLIARRVRVVSMDMQGIQSAYARVVTTRTFAAQVR